jgi:RloB-like protein
MEVSRSSKNQIWWGMSRNSRARGANSFRRRRSLRAPYERVLIVCEGEKTEPNYFEEIRQKARLSNAHIQAIRSELGTDPANVVRAAEKSFFDKHRGFERVYAVFDRDDHINYETAIQMAAAKNGKLRNDEKRAVIFEAIVSVPCFELWLLYTTPIAPHLFRATA